MAMAVVRVRPMAVGVLLFRMGVLVAVGPFGIPGVSVIVVKVAMDVGMRVVQRPVRMGMRVLFAGDEKDPEGHESRGRSERPTGGFAEKG